MKFMKLGSKPDLFQAKGDNIRYVATELSTDLIVNVADVKFYLHKFPLLSKSARLQKIVASTNKESQDEMYIKDIPGGAAAFEICAKFCYGMTVTLNAYNVVAARCAAEYLEMYETIDKGNLVYKIEVFLSCSIFRAWKDSIIVLETMMSLLKWSEELKLVSRCIDAVASNAETKDWWVEDLCDLDIELYKQVISLINSKAKVSSHVIGEALKVYAMRQLPGFSEGKVENRLFVETVVGLLPGENESVSYKFLISLLRAAFALDCSEIVRKQLMGRIARQLEEASVSDLLIHVSSSGEDTVYDVNVVYELVKEYISQERNESVSKGMVAKLVDCYLAEISRDPKLQLSSFMSLAELVSGFPRPSHDGLYRAIDMYLKEHPSISKSERKIICRLMDCKKLSAEACTHAVQNERLPLRVVVQVLFFEQAKVRASRSASKGGGTPELPAGGSHTTNTEEDWEGNEAEEVAVEKGKGLMMSKRLFSKLWSSKERDGENSSSDTSESPVSTNADETRSTPSSSMRR